MTKNHSKPRAPWKGPASHYAGPSETIVEFEGGLMSFRRNDEGKLVVELYRLDDDVILRIPEAHIHSIRAN